MQVVMLVILVLSMLDILIGTFIPTPDSKRERGYEGYSGKVHYWMELKRIRIDILHGK